MPLKQLFDDWPQRYDLWFETPLGRAVLKYETQLIVDFLKPALGEKILDAGCGTGIFTRAFVCRGAAVTGVDISFGMLHKGVANGGKGTYGGVVADMVTLPFADASFDKTVSVAALEFISDEKAAVAELFRVTKPGGVVVVATLNSLSPWAARRLAKARRDPESIFNRVFFRSPEQLLAATTAEGIVRTAVNFSDSDKVADLSGIEEGSRDIGRGAFVAARWEKQ